MRKQRPLQPETAARRIATYLRDHEGATVNDAIASDARLEAGRELHQAGNPPGADITDDGPSLAGLYD
jgi:hypothetical protein